MRRQLFDILNLNYDEAFLYKLRVVELASSFSDTFVGHINKVEMK